MFKLSDEEIRDVVTTSPDYVAYRYAKKFYRVSPADRAIAKAQAAHTAWAIVDWILELLGNTKVGSDG